MKTLCAFLFFIPILSFSQTTVSIFSGFTDAQAFTAVEPGPGSDKRIVYNSSVGNFPSGGSYEWSVANGSILGNVNYQDFVNVNWDNTNNVGANIKSISIKIKNSSGAIVAEDTRTITVKHIGTIGSISVNGTNVGNGGSSNLPCGTGNITISSAVPATDPSSAVSYNWSLPSGWSTANTTTTSNSITVTPSTNGGGNVSVTANRTDGTTTQSASINGLKSPFGPNLN
jgi:hypothetical protein